MFRRRMCGDESPGHPWIELVHSDGLFPFALLMFKSALVLSAQTGSGTVPSVARDAGSAVVAGEGALIVNQKEPQIWTEGNSSETQEWYRVPLPRLKRCGWAAPAPARQAALLNDLMPSRAASRPVARPTANQAGFSRSGRWEPWPWRVGKSIEWDAKRMRVKGVPEADRFIHHEYRKGWELQFNETIPSFTEV